MNKEFVEGARVGYEWGNSKKVRDKQKLFITNSKYRRLYLNIEPQLLDLLIQFEDKYVGIAFDAMWESEVTEVLNSAMEYDEKNERRLKDVGYQSTRFLRLMKSKKAAYALLRSYSWRSIPAVLPKECENSITAEMTKQQLPELKRILESPDSVNFLSATRQIVEYLPEELRQCSACPWEYENGYSIKIYQCLRHSYHADCWTSVETDCSHKDW